MDSNSFTPGVEYVIVQSEDIGEYSRGITYLMANGDRKRVVIQTSDDTPELRKRMGDAFASGRTGVVRGKTP